MNRRLLILILCFSALSSFAQKPKTTPVNPKSNVKVGVDELAVHLAAVEKFQKAGDFSAALAENQKVLIIALERLGNFKIEEGKYAVAVQSLSELLKFSDTASNRTKLAIAYLRQRDFEKALAETKYALALDPNHIGAHYIIGNIYYSQENYEAALPELEKSFAIEPDFELARALGLTYLNLKQIEKARKHFDKVLAEAGKEKVNLHVLLANFYQRTNYPLDSERELKQVLSLEPQKPKVNFYLGYLLMQNGGSGRLAEAGEYFQKELNINPRDALAWFFSGVVFSSLNDHPKAISALQKSVELNPTNGEAFLFLGQSQIETNDLASAEKNLRRAVELEANGGKNTQSRRTHFILGRLLMRLGKKEEAEKELAIAAKLQQSSLDSSRTEINRILGQIVEQSDPKLTGEKKTDASVEIKLSPERAAQLAKVNPFLIEVIAQSYNNLGVIATQNSNLSDAVDNFSAAFKWNPNLPGLARNLGIINFRTERFEEAVVPLASHLQTNPNDTLARKMLGTSYYLTKNFKAAVQTLQPIEAGLLEDAELAYFYGISLVQEKKNREALAIFNKLAEINQSKAEKLFYAAQGLMIAGDYNRAVTELTRVVALAPSTVQANYFIGQSLIRLNRYAEAEKAFAREIEINPADAVAKYHLALTLIERKIETDRAVSLLEEAINLRYGYADALYQLGKIYLEKGDAAKAVEKLETAATADGDKDYIHYQLSIAYRKLSRFEDSERELKIYQKLKADERKTDALLPMGGKETSIPKSN